jgi:pimeloyl-ACP methyl ester carboxylesterase
MDFVRSAVGLSINRRVFTPRASDYNFDFLHDAATLAFLPLVPQGGKAAADASRPQHDIPLIWIRAKREPGPAAATTASARRLVLVYLHGTGSNVGSHVDELLHGVVAHVPGVDMLLVEYNGYGISSEVGYTAGTTPALMNPSAPVLRRIGRRVLQFLVDERGVDWRDIVLCGRSMGTGLALELAAWSQQQHQQQQPSAKAAHAPRAVAGVVLLAPYTSIPRVVRGYLATKLPRALATVGVHVAAAGLLDGMARFASCGFFESASNVRELRSPLLIVHGTADNFIPIAHSHDLIGLATNAATAHLSVDPVGTHRVLAFERALCDFLRQLQSEPRQGAAAKASATRWPAVPLVPAELVPDRAEREERAARFKHDQRIADTLKHRRLTFMRVAVLMVLGVVVWIVAGIVRILLSVF